MDPNGIWAWSNQGQEGPEPKRGASPPSTAGDVKLPPPSAPTLQETEGSGRDQIRRAEVNKGSGIPFQPLEARERRKTQKASAISEISLRSFLKS